MESCYRIRRYAQGGQSSERSTRNEKRKGVIEKLKSSHDVHSCNYQMAFMIVYRPARLKMWHMLRRTDTLRISLEFLDQSSALSLALSLGDHSSPSLFLCSAAEPLSNGFPRFFDTIVHYRPKPPRVRFWS